MIILTPELEAIRDELAIKIAKDINPHLYQTEKEAEYYSKPEHSRTLKACLKMFDSAAEIFLKRESDNKKLNEFIEWLNVGYGGMFGTCNDSKEQDAYNMIWDRMKYLGLTVEE